MKTLKSAVLKVSEVIAIFTGMVLLCVYKVDSPLYFMIWVAVFMLSALTACYLTDKHIILSRITGLACVIIAFVAAHRRKITPTQLILLRRKNRIGNYYDFYLDSMERYHATIQ